MGKTATEEQRDCRIYPLSLNSYIIPTNECSFRTVFFGRDLGSFLARGEEATAGLQSVECQWSDEDPRIFDGRERAGRGTRTIEDGTAYYPTASVAASSSFCCGAVTRKTSPSSSVSMSTVEWSGTSPARIFLPSRVSISLWRYLFRGRAP